MKRQYKRLIAALSLILLFAAAGLALLRSERFSAEAAYTYSYYDIDTGETVSLSDALTAVRKVNPNAVINVVSSEIQIMYTVEIGDGGYCSIPLYLATVTRLKQRNKTASQMTTDDVVYTMASSYPTATGNEYHFLYVTKEVSTGINTRSYGLDYILDTCGATTSYASRYPAQYEGRIFGDGILYVKLNETYYVQEKYYLQYYKHYSGNNFAEDAVSYFDEDNGGTTLAVLKKTYADSTNTPVTDVSYSGSGINPVNTSDNNLYALRVSTGSTAASGIAMFAVNYVDGEGFNRTQYIMPYDGTYESSLKKALSAGYVRADNMNTLKTLGYSTVLEEYLNGNESCTLTPLDANSTDTYLVNFRTAVVEVTSIDVITDVSEVKTMAKWSCEGMEFFKVDELEGLDMIGTYSGSYVICFKGTKLAKTVCSGNSFMFSSPNGGQDAVFSITTETEGKTTNGSTSIWLNNALDTSEQSYDSLANDKIIYLKISMADVYGAGIEGYINPYGKKLTVSNYYLPETLAVRLNYTDTSGFAKTVTVPVVSSAIAYAMERGELTGSSTPIEFVSQGENLILKLHMYDYAGMPESTDNLTLYYSSSAAIEELCGIVDTVSTTEARNRRQEVRNAIGNTDDIAVLAVCTYESDGSFVEDKQVSVSLDNGTILKESINAEPTYCYFASVYTGSVISPTDNNTAHAFGLTKYGGTTKLPQAGNNRYVIAFRTSDIPLAATTTDITLQVGYRATAGGEENTTTGVLFSEAVKQYYGYWVGSDGTNVLDVASTMATRPGNWLYAYVEMNDVYQFTSVTLTLNGSDPWQCEAIAIYQLGSTEGFGERHAAWSEENLTNGTYSSDRYYSRDFCLNEEAAIETDSAESSTDESTTGENTTGESGEGTSSTTYDLGSQIKYAYRLILLPDQEIYLDGNSRSKKISFESEEVIEDVTLIDWRDTSQKSSMTYDQTQQELGLTEVKKTYTVTVHVGSQTYSNSKDDAGSSNYFYFQLVFTNGVSAYVQANQQLASDGFMEDKDNSFQIRTNYDYGELTAINIIPDDSTENANPYDKLMIKSIDVSVDTGENSSIVWEAAANSDNQWVGIDYSDDGGNESAATTSSRDIEQIRTTYTVTGRVLAAHLLIAVLTGENTSNFVAKQMKGTIYYTALDGTSKTMDITPISSIYDFTGSDRQVMNLPTAKGAYADYVVSDPETMFRKGKWDVFKIDCRDVASIDKLELAVQSVDNDAVWQVSAVEVYRITEDNGRKLSKNNEYTLNGSKVLVTDWIDENGSGITYSLDNSSDKNYIFEFEPQKVTLAETTVESYEQSRVPASENDYLNIAVYMDEEDAGDDYSKISLSGDIEFTNTYDSWYYATAKFTRTTTSSGRTVFYCNALGARNMLALTNVSLKATSAAGYNGTAKVSEIIAQRVRSGTVIETYRFYCGHVDALYGASFDSSETQDHLTTDYQEVTLQLGEATDNYNLTAETQDVAVAIRYTTTTGGSYGIYTSEFIFLTDQDINSVGPNQQVKLRFNEDFVNEITGIVVAVTGSGKKVNIESACIGTYAEKAGAVTVLNAMSDTDAGYECTGWYSVTNGATMEAQENTANSDTDSDSEETILKYVTSSGTTLQSESRTFSVNSSRKGEKTAVVPISMTFKTMDADADRSNYGTTGSVYMSITYKGVDNNTYAREIKDITVYTDENGNTCFSTGHTDTIKFMEQNMSNIISITLRPYDSDDTTVQTWGLESITLSYGDGTDVQDYTIPVNRIIYEETEEDGQKKQDGALISLKDVILTVTASAKNTETDTTDTVTMTTGENVTYDDGKKYPTIKLMDMESSDSDPSVGAVTFKLTVQNADDEMDGVTVTAKLASGGSDVSNYLSKDEDKNEIYFRPSGSRTTEVTYLVEFVSKANESVVAKVYVVAEPNTSYSSVSVSTMDVMEGENTAFIFTLSDTPAKEVTLNVTVTTASDTEGTGYTVTIPAGSKVGSLVLKDQPVGNVKATVTSASGGGFSTIDVLTANATCVVGAQCDVSLAAADITEGEDAVFTATLSQAAIASMTVSININGQTYAIPIQQGETSGTVTVTGLSAGSYTGTVTDIAGGGFVKVNYGGVNAQMTVNKQDAELKNFYLSIPDSDSEDTVKTGSKVTVTMTFDRTCTADMSAVLVITHNGITEEAAIDFYKGSSSGSVTFTPNDSASYIVAVKEFKDSCFNSIDISTIPALNFDATAN